MTKHFVAATCALLLALPASAAELIRLESPHSVAETVDRLEAAVTEAGARVFARVDHAAGAASVDQELAPVQMLMFGNPALGTPAIYADAAAGLDLPLRVVVYEGADGSVTLAYHDPASLAETHDIAADAEVITRMTGALAGLTGQAVAE
ncbi:MAG: DUF302 domain-containing protein [Pseudomonadota bacterium]